MKKDQILRQLLARIVEVLFFVEQQARSGRMKCRNEDERKNKCVAWFK